MNKTAIALEDIKSGKGSLYAPKGAKVTVYQQKHDTVWLCQIKTTNFLATLKN